VGTDQRPQTKSRLTADDLQSRTEIVLTIESESVGGGKQRPVSHVVTTIENTPRGKPSFLSVRRHRCGQSYISCSIGKDQIRERLKEEEEQKRPEGRSLRTCQEIGRITPPDTAIYISPMAQVATSRNIRLAAIPSGCSSFGRPPGKRPVM
jgi:hypothetical protein